MTAQRYFWIGAYIGANVDPGLVYIGLTTAGHVHDTYQSNILLYQQEQGLLADARC